MHKITRILRICLLYTLTAFMVGSYPLTALAETTPVTPTQVTTEVQPVKPADTTLPAGQTITPLPVSTSPSGGSTPAVVSPPSPVQTAPLTPPSETSTTIKNSAAPPQPSATDLQKVAEPTKTTVTSPTTTTVISPVTNGVTVTPAPVTSSTTATTKTGVTNGLKSSAKTGDTQATANTTIGDAGTGNALATTTIINSVHSTAPGSTSGVARFTTDINGNVNGNITLAPSLDAALAQGGVSPLPQNVLVNNSANLTNNITLGATSGNADVTQNTTAGNVSTGSANAVANVMNLINSIIAANKSFIGTINIYGNLNGDILVSPNFIPQLLASNAPSSPTYSALSPLPTSLTSANNQSIINNINLQAMSGKAQVDSNTTAGNITTGASQTNLTVLNLTGQKVIAGNCLLVFVNVLGKWVGMIVNAPAGATAAALGSGVISNSVTPLGQSANIQNNGQITNNIALAAQSGNANVLSNTTVGNTSTGMATASANIANINTSSFSLSDWFGVLFINVFGSWYGSFGVNTATGQVIPIDPGSTIPTAAAVSPVAPVVFGFTPPHRSQPSRYFTTLSMEPSGVKLSNWSRRHNSTTPDQSIVRTAGMTNGSQDGDTSGDSFTDQVIQPDTTHTVNNHKTFTPLSIAMMAAGIVGVTAPVLAGIGRRRRG